jgi:hypothetical protein
VRRLSPFTFAILGFVALSAGCSRLSVDWMPKPHEIAITAHGFTNADLLILAGSPSGPMLRRETPEVWATIGPVPGGSGIEIARVQFDETGIARVTVADTQLPAGKTLIQALAIARDETRRAMAVSDCMTVTWNDGVPSLRHHALDVLTSPVAVRLLGVAALVLACFLLRRLEVEAPFGRGPRLAVVFLVAAFLFLSRLVPSEHSDGAGPTEPPPLWPRPVPAEKEGLDPLDRVATPGFRELVDNVRTKVPAAAPIAILPAGDSGEAYRDAWQTAWLVWPHRTEVLRHDADPFARRGVYVILGQGPKARSVGVLFRNQAGSVWSIEEGEPR